MDIVIMIVINFNFVTGPTPSVALRKWLPTKESVVTIVTPPSLPVLVTTPSGKVITLPSASVKARVVPGGLVFPDPPLG